MGAADDHQPIGAAGHDGRIVPLDLLHPDALGSCLRVRAQTSAKD
jgi:hypothetical protein